MSEPNAHPHAEPGNQEPAPPPAAASEAEEAPSLLSSPVIRVTIGVTVLAVVVVCVGFIVLNLALNARRQPIEVEAYPGAYFLGGVQAEPGHDFLTYTTTDAADTVAAFYQERYDTGEDQRCVRVENVDDDPNLPRFEVRCVIDNSTVNAYQAATITVQPHTSGEYAGLTVIRIERFWQE
ncbi:MAG: hypothetical protein Kow00120_09370 [Anaerolineae bacterium]